jgi:hypothetical protein
MLGEEKKLLGDNHYYLHNSYTLLAQAYLQQGEEAKCREAIAHAKEIASKIETTTTAWRAETYELEAELEDALGNEEAADKAWDTAWALIDGEVTGNTYTYLKCFVHYMNQRFKTADTSIFNDEIKAAIAKVKAVDFEINDIGEYADFVAYVSDYSYGTGQPSFGIDLIEYLLSQVPEEDDTHLYLSLCLTRLYSINGECQKAIDIEKQCLQIMQERYPNQPENYVDVLFDLGDFYYQNKDFDKAEVAYKKVNKIYKSLGKEFNGRYIQTVHKLAVICSRKSDYEGALGYLEDCLQMMKKTSVASELDFAFLYSELASCNADIKRDKNQRKALEYRKLACEKYEALGETNDENYVKLRLAVIEKECVDLSAYEQAINELLSKMNAENIVGQKNIVFLKKALSDKIMGNGEYERALAVLNEAIAVAEQLPVYDCNELYNEKCSLLTLLNRADEAWALADDYYVSTEQKNGRLSPEHIAAIGLYQFVVDRTLSLEKLEMLPAMGETVLEYLATMDKKDPSYLLYSNVAALCFNGTDVDKSREIVETALKNVANHLSDISDYYLLATYTNLASWELSCGDMDAALRYTYLLLERCDGKVVLQNKSAAYAQAAEIFLAANKLREAENTLLKGIECEEQSKTTDIAAFRLYKTATELYNKLGQPEKAIAYFTKLTDYTNSVGNETMTMVNQLLPMVYNYQTIGMKYNYADIEALEAYAQKHPNAFDRSIIANLKARYYLSEGNKDEAVKYADEALEINRNLNNLGIACEVYLSVENYPMAEALTQEQLQILRNDDNRSSIDFVAAYKRLGDIYLLTNQLAKSYDYYEDAFDASVSYINEHILTLTDKQRTDFWNSNSAFYNSYLPNIATSHDYAAAMNGLLYNSALFSNGFLLSANQSMANIVKDASSDIKQMYSKYMSKKMELTKANESYCNDADVQQIQSECEKAERELITNINERYPDALEYKQYTWKDVERNLPTNSAAVEYIDFPSDNTTNTVAALVLKKGMDMPVTRVLYHYNCGAAPSGIEVYKNTSLGDSLVTSLSDLLADCQDVYFSPQGLLCSVALESLPRTESALPQNLKLYRVSSTRVLAEKRAKRKDFKATLFGGLNYNTSVDSLLADASNYPELRDRGYVADNLFRANNRESDVEIPPLPGTLKEVNSISNILATNKRVKANVKVGNDGTETAFKALSGKYGSILHVSTHGFFNNVDGAQQSSALTFEDMALDECGLLMAGASHRYLDEEPLPNNLDDGILKASEIAKLDLKNVDLAVLSACETGLGAVTGDGVFGLQRGFKKAGVNSILMSLWKVDDDATCALMTEFYTNWLHGKSKYEALELAKTYIKQQAKWADPKYWAAFILLDALN